MDTSLGISVDSLCSTTITRADRSGIINPSASSRAPPLARTLRHDPASVPLRDGPSTDSGSLRHAAETGTERLGRQFRLDRLHLLPR